MMNQNQEKNNEVFQGLELSPKSKLRKLLVTSIKKKFFLQIEGYEAEEVKSILNTITKIIAILLGLFILILVLLVILGLERVLLSFLWFHL